MSQDKKASAKKLFDQGETIAAIARQLDVSRRTIERWADDGAWREKRGVIPIGEAKKKAPPESTHRNPPSIRSHQRRDSGDIDELEIVDLAISDLSATLSGGEVDARSLGGIAGALVRLLEYRRKIVPKSAADLADMAIALDISPKEFILTLHEKCRERA